MKEMSELKQPSVVTELMTSGVDAISTANGCINSITKFCELVSDTIKTCQQEQTKREAIRATCRVEVEKIHQTADIIKTYLDRTFDERASIFNKYFNCVDEALRTGNLKLLELSLSGIDSLAKQSPFKNLSDFEKTQQALLDDSTVWDI